MKKLYCLVLALVIGLNMIVPAYATPGSTPREKLAFQSLADIPIFVAKTDSLDDATKDAINGLIRESISERSATKAIDSLIASGRIEIRTAQLDIMELTSAEREEAFTSGLFTAAFKAMQETIDQGEAINHITLYLPAGGSIMAVGAVDDPSYWENMFPVLGTYNGYKFLYSEASASRKTPFVEVANLSPSINWSALPGAIIKASIDFFVNQVADNILDTIGTLANFFGIIQPPLPISYGASGTYLEYNVSGDLYYRTIYIRDLQNKVPGYAYYQWGLTQRFRGRVTCNPKWAVKPNDGGGYEYFTEYKSGPYLEVKTSGYDEETAPLASILNRYNGAGYMPHEELLDVQNIIYNMFP